jgi:hypothetical protein
MIGIHITKRCIHATLGRNSMRACRQHLANHRNATVRVSELQGTAKSGATGPDNHDIVKVMFNLIRRKVRH